MKEIMPGDRVMVFDHRLFQDDVSTPLTTTMQPATVVCRYGYKYYPPTYLSCYDYDKPWTYPDVCDVVFDHRPQEVSKSHFTWGIRHLEGP